MTSNRTSRELTTQGQVTSGLTLADVLVAITAADLPPPRRHDMASAVRIVARLIGTPPDRLPATPGLLNRRLGDIAPAAHGMTTPRWANIRSLLRAALRLVGPMPPGRHLNPLAPPWHALWDALQPRDLKIGLSRFMRYCSAQGVEPAQVSTATFDSFAAHLRGSILKDPEGGLRSVRSSWARAQAAVPAWPAISWPKPPRRQDHFSLPWTTFPPSLCADAERWLARLRGDDPLALHRRPLRPESLKNMKQRIRAFAAALVHRGRDPMTLRGLADLVQPDAAKEGLLYYLGRNGNKPGPGVSLVAIMLLSIARNYVEAPPDHIAALKDMAMRLSPPRQRGMVARNRARLRAFDDPRAVQALVHLPQRMMAEADALPRGKRAALTAQTALAIDILLVAPMRIKNLAAIDIETNLVRPGRSRNVVVVSFEREEVKNGEALDYPLPDQTVAMLERYLAEYRVLLTAPSNLALFPSSHGRAKSRSVLGPRISRAIFERTALRVNPHLFRHIAAKLQLEAEPASYENVRRLLGHASLGTTIQAYTGTETAAAVRHYDRIIERLRTGSAGR